MWRGVFARIPVLPIIHNGIRSTCQPFPVAAQFLWISFQTDTKDFPSDTKERPSRGPALGRLIVFMTISNKHRSCLLESNGGMGSVRIQYRFWIAQVSALLLCFFVSQQLSSAQVSLTLSWVYPSTNETGFGVQRATSSSGPWTQVGTVVAPTTSYLDTGLNYSTTYYYQVWSYNAAGNSPLSSIASFTTAATPEVQLSVTPTRQFILTVTGQTNHTYNIQASQDLKTWTIIGTVTLVAGGSVNFTDTNAASFPKRFYRTQDTQP
jgi:hypothetical protein